MLTLRQTATASRCCRILSLSSVRMTCHPRRSNYVVVNEKSLRVMINAIRCRLPGGTMPPAGRCKPSRRVVEGVSMLKHFASLTNVFAKLRSEDRGVTSVEYGLMVALIAIVIIIAVTLLGTNLSSLFNYVANAI